ncbi:hypothetical protein Aab01nite_31240 [Paractinoplanes abujensis]|uniref:Uncharacterized protein n=1 Tax=Paractinoplanes abujensis TaxID=882441 RepID=A0A7W7D2X5_9ACTN|nr:CATRA conflict system CASPASE/TPR repeat-associated protein [Actinoplanes abujensis]MBB4697983.1 hypothetical protein [Actinoplanes abujensis]GID19534.1 hypothetical protein Aab01nite_31240 [Actinoplanes abujensis]
MTEDQELAAHAFLPLSGPQSAGTWTDAGAFWARCRSLLGLSEATAPGVPVDLPAAPIAAARDHAGRYKLTARCERDLLTVSLLFAARTPASARRVRIGSANGWADFTRWWSQLAKGVLGTAIGTCLVFGARRSAADTDARRWAAALPPAPDDADGWWRHPRELRPGTLIWDVTAGPHSRNRRLVVLTRPGDGTGPSTRSLALAARLRYEARMHGLSASLVREVRESASKVAGWRLAEARWQRVDRALRIALDAAEASDGHALGSAAGQLESLGPIRLGRVGGSPALPCPPPIHARLRRLSIALDAEAR